MTLKWTHLYSEGDEEYASFVEGHVELTVKFQILAHEETDNHGPIRYPGDVIASHLWIRPFTLEEIEEGGMPTLVPQFIFCDEGDAGARPVTGFDWLERIETEATK